MERAAERELSFSSSVDLRAKPAAEPRRASQLARQDRGAALFFCLRLGRISTALGKRPLGEALASRPYVA